jgi:hypothetical protein
VRQFADDLVGGRVQDVLFLAAAAAQEFAIDVELKLGVFHVQTCRMRGKD